MENKSSAGSLRDWISLSPVLNKLLPKFNQIHTESTGGFNQRRV